MTDGQSTDPSATVKMAEALHRDGVQVIAIGIGSQVKTTELAVIASGKDHMFTAANFSALASIENELTLATCRGENSFTQQDGSVNIFINLLTKLSNY